jgi:cyclohexanecarboxylate-CoA ligase
VSLRPADAIAATRSSPQADRYVADGHWPGRLLDQDLADAVRLAPERTAIVAGERRLDFAALAAAVEQAAGMLAGLGIGHGDVVSFQLPNWLEAAVVHHAAVRLGAVSNPIPSIYRAREVGFILAQARTSVLIVPDVFRRFDYRRMVAEIRGELPLLRQVLVVGEADEETTSFAAALEAGGTVPEVERHASDVVLLLYTSGTEADPKGVLHSHDTLAYECRSIIELFGLGEQERVFMPSPVTHITGLLYGLHLPLMLTAPVVLQDVWDVADACALIERERCTFTVGATPFLHGLVHAPAAVRGDISSLRTFGCGGADIPPALIAAAHERGLSASRLYGSTECPTATGTPIGEPLERHAETDGRPIGAAEVRVLDASGEAVGPGVRGDLQVRGPELCLGYLDASLNERAFREDGWFATGDLAVLDEQGAVRIAGRVKDIIVRGGENLSTKEIEDLLFEHPDVVEVAVVGYPDPVLGERACAFVVSSAEALGLEELVAFLRERRVANQKLPEHLRIVAELPKTASGKVQKFRLRERLREEVAQATETLLADFRTMVRIRAFEERVARYFREGEIPGFVHVSIGQEAIASGVCGSLEQHDYITTTHRGHGHCLAKGADPDAMMAELFGRASGTCGGKGGSMHIADPRIGILGANGIVGAGLPIAVGAALAAQRRGTGAVAVAFAGEGTVASGAFHEALTLAALWQAPVVFVVENNGWAEFTDSETLRRGAPLVERALGYGLRAARRIDGNDVGVVRAAAQEAIAAARAGDGPSLIEAMTYRVHGHYEGDPAAYRDDAELAAWRERDPLELARRALEQAGRGAEGQQATAAAEEEMDRAVVQGLAAPAPDPATVLTDVYA